MRKYRHFYNYIIFSSFDYNCFLFIIDTLEGNVFQSIRESRGHGKYRKYLCRKAMLNVERTRKLYLQSEVCWELRSPTETPLQKPKYSYINVKRKPVIFYVFLLCVPEAKLFCHTLFTRKKV